MGVPQQFQYVGPGHGVPPRQVGDRHRGAPGLRDQLGAHQFGEDRQARVALREQEQLRPQPRMGQGRIDRGAGEHPAREVEDVRAADQGQHRRAGGIDQGERAQAMAKIVPIPVQIAVAETVPHRQARGLGQPKQGAALAHQGQIAFNSAGAADA
ncbi:MAG: hypothetical protein V4656_05810 [Pseudomonadota bacterium]